MITSFILICALLLDRVFGEPKRFHPLVGFGHLANWLENKLNSSSMQSAFILRLSGLLGWSLLVLVFVAVIYLIEYSTTTYFPVYGQAIEIIVGILCLGFAIGEKSLRQHACAIEQAVNSNDLPLARQRIAMIVSRDTTNSDITAINKATIESVLENGNDAIFAAIFWFVILGAPGVVLFRLANTLDAMWGYHTERYRYFGWAAARIDDVLNWVPARLTAVSYSIAGHTRTALKCWWQQAKHWHGFNPGVVMASGAGALQLKLGGKAFYHGKEITRPDLGLGREPETNDIKRALNIVQRSVFIWVISIILIDYLKGFYFV